MSVRKCVSRNGCSLTDSSLIPVRVGAWPISEDTTVKVTARRRANITEEN
jgi:hypothetical protein